MKIQQPDYTNIVNVLIKTNLTVNYNKKQLTYTHIYIYCKDNHANFILKKADQYGQVKKCDLANIHHRLTAVILEKYVDICTLAKPLSLFRVSLQSLIKSLEEKREMAIKLTAYSTALNLKDL